MVKKSFVEKLAEILSNNLLFLLFIPIVSIVGGIIIRRGYSLKVNTLFFVWVLVLVGFVISLNNIIMYTKKGLDIRKATKRILLISTVFLVFFSISLLSAGLSEPMKGTLIIHIHENSTRKPDKIFVNRGFSWPLSLLDVRKELTRDYLNNKFSTSEFIRCGKWFLVPEPLDQYDPIEKTLYVPQKSPYKTEDKILFHKRLCNVHFSTKDTDGNPIDGAKIEIDPIPYGFDTGDKTPSFMKLEMGTYLIIFKLEGYEAKTIERTFSPDTEIKVIGTLKKINIEPRQPKPIKPDPVGEDNASKPHQKEPKAKIIPFKKKHSNSHIDDKLTESVRYFNMMRQVRVYVNIRKFDEAQKILKEIISKHSGNRKSEAQKILDEIQKITKEEI